MWLTRKKNFIREVSAAETIKTREDISNLDLTNRKQKN